MLGRTGTELNAMHWLLRMRFFPVIFIGFNSPVFYILFSFLTTTCHTVFTAEQTSWPSYTRVSKINSKLTFNCPIPHIQFVCVPHRKCLESTGNGRLYNRNMQSRHTSITKKKKLWYRIWQHISRANRIFRISVTRVHSWNIYNAAHKFQNNSHVESRQNCCHLVALLTKKGGKKKTCFT